MIFMLLFHSYFISILVYYLCWIYLNKNSILSYHLISVYSFNLFDNSDSDCVFHVSYSKAAQWRIISKFFTAKWLHWFHKDQSGVTVLDWVRIFFFDSSSSSINFGSYLFEFASNMGSMAVYYWSISVFDWTWVIDNNDLSNELFNLFRWVILSISCNKSSFDLISLQFDIKSNVFSRISKFYLFMMHLNWFNFSLKISWSKNYVCFSF